jgi:pheromone shutdown protein TraB
MTGADSRTRATGVSRAGVLARVTVATLLVLAAPAVSFLLTTGILGSGASVEFPHGYAVTLIVTVLVTAAARWAIISFAVTVAGVSLGHAHLTELGIAILAAALAGLAVGLPLAARR